MVGTGINVVLTILAAYPLSRRDMAGRGFIMFLMTFTLLFHGGLIPTYVLIQKLGIMNTRWAMLLPSAMGVWNVIITRTYYQSYVPSELLEAAKIDGANDFSFVWRVVIPLSGAITAVNVLFYAVGHWNSYFPALLYLHDQNLFPLQLFLRQILIINDIDTDMMQNLDVALIDEGRLGLMELIKFAIIIVASVPVLCHLPIRAETFHQGCHDRLPEGLNSVPRGGLTTIRRRRGGITEKEKDMQSRRVLRGSGLVLLILLLAGAQAAFAGGEEEGAAASGVMINGVGQLPIVDEPYTLTVAAIIPPNIVDISTNTATQWAEEQTNVKIEWQTLQWGGEGRNKANLMLASGADLPDIFLGNQIVRGVDFAYGSQGLLVALNDYIDNESVHIKKLYEQIPLTASQMTMPDGNIYSIGSMSLIRQNRPYAKAWYNDQFMETLGMGIPDTTDGFLELLRKAKVTDVNGNGDPNDEIPFTGEKGEIPQLFTMNAFVYVDWRRINVDENGKLWSPIVTEQFRDGLRYQHQLYAEGLWDREQFVQDQQQMKQLVMGGDAARPVIISQHIKNRFIDAGHATYNNWFNNYPSLQGPDGHRTAAFNPFSTVPGWGAITTEADEPLVAWRWFEFLATQDAQWRIYQGEEGQRLGLPRGRRDELLRDPGQPDRARVHVGRAGAEPRLAVDVPPPGLRIPHDRRRRPVQRGRPPVPPVAQVLGVRAGREAGAAGAQHDRGRDRRVPGAEHGDPGLSQRELGQVHHRRPGRGRRLGRVRRHAGADGPGAHAGDRAEGVRPPVRLTLAGRARGRAEHAGRPRTFAVRRDGAAAVQMSRRCGASI